MTGSVTHRLKRRLDSAMHGPLYVRNGQAMRLDILHIIVDLDIERRFIDLNLVIRVEPCYERGLIEHASQPNIGRLCSLLRNLRVSSKRLPSCLGLPSHLLGLKPDVILDQIIDQLVQMRLAVVYLR